MAPFEPKACEHVDEPHTMWYWLEDNPYGFSPTAPYTARFDNYDDALSRANDLIEGATPALRWVKLFRSDNESYTCFKWTNPEPFQEAPHLVIEYKDKTMYRKIREGVYWLMVGALILSVLGYVAILIWLTTQ